jgi:hypothetical protein
MGDVLAKTRIAERFRYFEFLGRLIKGQNSKNLCRNESFAIWFGDLIRSRARIAKTMQKVVFRYSGWRPHQIKGQKNKKPEER